jgi:hypothetical protein
VISRLVEYEQLRDAGVRPLVVNLSCRSPFPTIISSPSGKSLSFHEEKPHLGDEARLEKSGGAQ